MTNLLAAALPHGQFWAILPSYATATAHLLSHEDYEAHVAEYNALSILPRAENPVKAEDRRYEVVGTTAVIRISGVMTKRPTSYGGASTVLIRRAVEMAVRDTDAKSILLVIDSPGGSVDGTKDLGDSIAVANTKKKVTSYIDGQGCSAAYWVASQSGRVIIRDMSVTGSLGTMMVLTDTSDAAHAEGYQVIPITTGVLKGQPIAGVKISEEVLTMYRAHIDDLNEYFKAAVSAGRGFSRKKTDDLFTGATFLSKDALALGLVDQIGTLDDAFTFCDSEEGDEESDDEDFGAMNPAALAGVQASASHPVTTRPVTPTISAPQGGEPSPNAGQQRTPPVASGTNKMDLKYPVVRALDAFGLGTLAAKIANSGASDENEIANALASGVNAQVEEKMAANPLIIALAANKITSPDHLASVMELKAVGEKVLGEARADAHRLAISAYGSVDGPKMSAMVDTLGYDQAVKVRDSFALASDLKNGNTDAEPAKRQTAPAGTTAVDADAKPEAKTAWEKLPENMRAAAASQGYDTDEKRELFAKNYLEMNK